MKNSLLFATLVLAFGLAVGCSDDSKSGKSGGNGDANPTCSSNETYSDYYDQCLVVNSCPSGYGIRPGSNQCVLLEPGGGGIIGGGTGSTVVYGDLNVTNGNKFASFLESYGYTAFTQPFCSDNRDNSIFMFQFGFLASDCNTFNSAQIAIEFSDRSVANDNSTVAIVYIYAYASWAGTRTLRLPIYSQVAEVRRSNGDTEFRIQGTLNKFTTPPDLAQWTVRGDTIDIYDNGGTNLILEWDGSQIGTSSAPLY